MRKVNAKSPKHYSCSLSSLRTQLPPLFFFSLGFFSPPPLPLPLPWGALEGCGALFLWAAAAERWECWS